MIEKTVSPQYYLCVWTVQIHSNWAMPYSIIIIIIYNIIMISSIIASLSSPCHRSHRHREPVNPKPNWGPLSEAALESRIYGNPCVSQKEQKYWDLKLQLIMVCHWKTPANQPSICFIIVLQFHSKELRNFVVFERQEAISTIVQSQQGKQSSSQNHHLPLQGWLAHRTLPSRFGLHVHGNQGRGSC